MGHWHPYKGSKQTNWTLVSHHKSCHFTDGPCLVWNLHDNRGGRFYPSSSSTECNLVLFLPLNSRADSRPCLFTGIHGIPIWEFWNSYIWWNFWMLHSTWPLRNSTKKKKKGLELLNFQRTFEIFQMTKILQCLWINLSFANSCPSGLSKWIVSISAPSVSILHSQTSTNIKHFFYE